MFAVAIGAEVVVGLPLVLLLKKLGRAGFPR